MRVYTYSEARQKLSEVLEQAESTGKVLIRRKDGRVFALRPEREIFSPLDIPSVTANISTREIVEIIRQGREKGRTWRSTGSA
jgi:antitoxin Phd